MTDLKARNQPPQGGLTRTCRILRPLLSCRLYTGRIPECHSHIGTVGWSSKAGRCRAGTMAATSFGMSPTGPLTRCLGILSTTADANDEYEGSSQDQVYRGSDPLRGNPTPGSSCRSAGGRGSDGDDASKARVERRCGGTHSACPGGRQEGCADLRRRFPRSGAPGHSAAGFRGGLPPHRRTFGRRHRGAYPKAMADSPVEYALRCGSAFRDALPQVAVRSARRRVLHRSVHDGRSFSSLHSERSWGRRVCAGFGLLRPSAAALARH